MEPTLRPGDRVLVDRGAYRSHPPSVGDVVAAADPADPARWLVKRIAAVGPTDMAIPGSVAGDPGERPRAGVPAGTVFLVSEALDLGRDSRRFGPLPLAALRGRVWYRYAPSDRTGPIPPAVSP